MSRKLGYKMDMFHKLHNPTVRKQLLSTLLTLGHRTLVCGRKDLGTTLKAPDVLRNPLDYLYL